MARIPNPFRPGFNQPPAALEGRASVIAAINEAIDVAALDGRTPRPVVLTGGRGVGKTVLLGEAAAIAAEARSWLSVPIEIRPGKPFMPQLLDRLARARDLYLQAPVGRPLEVAATTLRASVLGIGAEVELRRAPGREPVRDLENLLTETCEAADRHNAGLLITIDELQFANRTELAEFAATLQQHVPDNWALVIVLAGLPSIRDAQKSVTYLERAEWHVLGLLDETASRAALSLPAAESGRPMSDEACLVLAAASGGYPYAIQVMGHHVWRASAGASTITVEHAHAAVGAAERDLAAGLYESRWQDASPKEREYLAAVARLSSEMGGATSRDVAAELGSSTAKVSYLRSRLMLKGTLFVEGNQIHFPIPGMARWIIDSTRGSD